MVTTKATKTWPRLSETLRGPRHPNICQACGAEHDITDGIAIHRWQEHDEHDQPEPIIVVLCAPCGEQRIDKHPRLYRSLHTNEPWPGCMHLCVACVSREGVRCTHPALTANGGPGLAITGSEPRMVFLDGTTKGGGRRIGWTELWYDRLPTSCAGRQAREEESSEPS